MNFKEAIITVNVKDYNNDYNGSLKNALEDYFSQSNEHCNEVKVDLLCVVDEGTKEEEQEE